jgi:hypothetical protein
MITNFIAPGDTTTPREQPCDTCLADHAAHSVQVAGTTTITPIASQKSYDETGALHVHTGEHSIYRYRCSNGHEWAERFIYQCPSCDWTVDNQDDTP